MPIPVGTGVPDPRDEELARLRRLRDEAARLLEELRAALDAAAPR